MRAPRLAPALLVSAALSLTACGGASSGTADAASSSAQASAGLCATGCGACGCWRALRISASKPARSVTSLGGPSCGSWNWDCGSTNGIAGCAGVGPGV